MKVLYWASALAMIGACGAEDQTDSQEQAVVTVSHMTDATTGGTADFYFMTPTAPSAPASFSGPYNGTFSNRLKVDIVNQDCNTLATSTVAYEFNGVPSYPTLQSYRSISTLAAMGLQDHHCYQIQPLLDGAVLGTRDVKVESQANATPTGVLRWNGTANVIIGFSLRNIMDTDGDGFLNHVDQCPTAAGPNNGCPIIDNCPSDPNKMDPGACGCGFTDVDNDGDGHYDSTGGGSGASCDDQCDANSAKQSPGQCGCNAADTDTDGDGTADCVDVCPNDSRFTTTSGICGCNAYYIDVNEDGTPETCSSANTCVLAP